MRQSNTQAPVLRRVHYGGRGIREVKHPLAPEILVAEIAGELPPEVANAVRQHVASCDSCGDRSRALAVPYELLGSLGTAPVPYIPDLRRRVRERLARRHFFGRMFRAALSMVRGGLASLTVLTAIVMVAAVVLATNALRSPSSAQPAANQVTAPPSAGSSGLLIAQDGNVTTVLDGSRHGWTVAEILVVDERNGQVLRSLPTGNLHYRRAGTDELPVAVTLSPDTHTVFELAGDGHGHQALIALDTQAAGVRAVTPLVIPGELGSATPAAVSLAVSPDGNSVYVGLGLGEEGLAGPRVLIVGANGTLLERALAPILPAQAPLPPPSGQLPGVVVTPSAGSLATTTLRPSLPAGGALFSSPDGLDLFDLIGLADTSGRPQGIVIRRFSVSSGATKGVLALPGDFTVSAMAASPNAARPCLYIARVGNDGQAYILSAASSGPTLLAQVPLGGPSTLAEAHFDGTVTVSPTADGAQAYISDDVVPQGYQLGAHDTWLLDSVSATIVSHRLAFTEAGQALANWTGGADSKVFVLLAGQVELLPRDLVSTSSPTTWLQLRGDVPISRLVGTAP